MTTEPIPWAVMLRGAVRLGLTPAAFWALSLKEWMWLSRAPDAGHVLDGQGAAVLRARLREFDKGD
jgi:hypothetical protein